ncbi:MAG TPA: hypothetical protein VLV87_01215 [Gammaproteobacteria bacterium]|nr:hypothetical protein [Gammaproteobacteria bacterium]
MRQVVLACGAVALAFGMAGCSTRDAPSEPVTVTADIPAAGLQHLKFDGTSGDTKIGISPDDAVHVKLVLQQQERRILGMPVASDATLRDVERAKIAQDRKGDLLTVTASYPSGSSHDSDVKTQWTIQVPARFGVDSTMKAGRMIIEGMTGGVKAQLAAGEVVIHVPSGPIYGHLSAGRLHVISDALEPRNVKVKSTFGLAVLSLHGEYYGPPPEKDDGFWSHLHMFGNTLNEHAGGKDDADLEVTAGLADLRFGPLGDKEIRRDMFTEDMD